MSLGAWIAWGFVVAAAAVAILGELLEHRDRKRQAEEIDRLNAVVFGKADEPDVREALHALAKGRSADNQARAALNDLKAQVEALTAFVTKQDDEQPTGRHAHSGEIRTSYVRVD